MSDCFDHELDAFERAEAPEEWGYPSHTRNFSRRIRRYSSRLQGEYPRSPEKTCNRCGTKNLWWKKTEDGWRLFTQAGKQHVCPKNIDTNQRPALYASVDRLDRHGLLELQEYVKTKLDHLDGDDED
jgi:hypothetical protein